MDNNEQAESITTGAEAVHTLNSLCGNQTEYGDHFHREASVAPPLLNDADILGVLFDLFAGRTQFAFGEAIDWWAETFQCDLAPETASGVALVALSKWPFDQRAGAAGVKALQDELVKRARMLIARGARVIEEAA